MARTKQNTTQHHPKHPKHPTMRRTLRREVAGTFGLLADEADFAAMRRYRTFTFDDHTTYLREAEQLLKSLASQGRHTTVALFDPVEYDAFCAESGIDPDTSAARSRYTARLAADGATLPYDGRPLSDLVPDLIAEALRQSTRAYAESLLADIGACADCGEDIGQAAYARAVHLLTRVLHRVAGGRHHLVCSVSPDSEPLLAVLRAQTTDSGTVLVDEAAATDFTMLLAAGIATSSHGGIVLRTSNPGEADQVCGWRLRNQRLLPLTAAEVFDAYCTDSHTGEPVPPESGVDYAAPPDLGPDEEPHPH
ncbi:hypothetical protein [Streptomyces apocyni]|uniref:hypothetical protein n=1 Tax=Streptomyces apocyni TaxID=2654677 RepID=UPI0012EAD1CB|nr:hypothetical protein [Streptomyces apocyni]